MANNIDTSRWPLLIINAARRVQTEDEFRADMDFIGRLYRERPGPYAMVIDTRRGTQPPAHIRRVMSEYREKYALHVRRYCRGHAFVIDSGLMRGVMTAMYWLRKPDAEVRVCRELDEALGWASNQLALSGVAVRLAVGT
jgi:hypothetical protein